MTRIRENYNFSPNIRCLCKNDTPYINEFYCNVDSLDRYLKEYAMVDLENGNGVTYLVIDKDVNKLAAYYTLSCNAIFTKNGLSSSININMFAVARDYQDIKYYNENHEISTVSSTILWELIGNIYNMSKTQVGIKYVSLHSLDSAVNFYIKNSFFTVSEEVLPQEFDINVSSENCIPMLMNLFPEYN